MAKAKVKLDLRGLTNAELIQKTRTVISQSTGNAVATGSPVTLAQLGTGADELETKQGEADANHQTGLTLTSQVGTKRTGLLDLLTGFGGYVDIKAAGDESQIRSTASTCGLRAQRRSGRSAKRSTCRSPSETTTASWTWTGITSAARPVT